MKPRKLKIIISILALCICLSAMVVGVYSVKILKFQTTGSIGFVVHSCKVNVVGTVTGAMRGEEHGYAVVNDKTYTNQGASSSETWADKFEKTTAGDDKNLITDSDKWNLGEIYFDDIRTSNNEVSDVTISFVIKNYSDFPIKASANFSQISNVTITSSEVYLDACENDTPKSGSFKILYSINDKASAVSLNQLNISLNFEKNEEMPPSASDYGTLSDYKNGKQLTIEPVFANLKPNENGEIVIPSKLLDENGELVHIDCVNFVSGSINSSATTLKVSEGIADVIGFSTFPFSINTLVLPSTLNCFDLSQANFKIQLDENNAIFGINTDGSVLYKKEDGTVVWTSDNVTALNIPEGVKAFPNLTNKNYTSISLPASLESFNGTYVPSTVGTITLADGCKYVSEDDEAIYYLNGEIKQICWAKNGEYVVSTTDLCKFNSSNVTKVIYNADAKIYYGKDEISDQDYYIGGFYNSNVVEVVFNVYNSSANGNHCYLGYSFDMYYGYGRCVKKVYTSENISMTLDSFYSSRGMVGYKKESTSSKSGYVEWTAYS